MGWLETTKNSQTFSTRVNPPILLLYVSNPLVSGTTKKKQNIVSGPASLLVNLNVSIVVGMEDCHDLVPSAYLAYLSCFLQGNNEWNPPIHPFNPLKVN